MCVWGGGGSTLDTVSERPCLRLEEEGMRGRGGGADRREGWFKSLKTEEEEGVGGEG